MRMDAALDAMRQLGFEEKLVRGTIKELLDVGLFFNKCLKKKKGLIFIVDFVGLTNPLFFLQVYEGTQGWPFIEEGSYKLLIETILCKQQTCVQKMVLNLHFDSFQLLLFLLCSRNY